LETADGAKSEGRNPRPEGRPKSESPKTEGRDPNLNAETRRAQKDAEKLETASGGMQETPDLSARLCALRVSAL